MTSPQILDGRFEVVRQLGRGGMGVVYEVVHVLTKQRAALKLLHHRYAQDPEVVERFAREASAAGRIRNAHIIGISDAGKFADGTPYLVMELLQGEPLAELLRTEGRLEIADAVSITLQACNALAAAHAAGIVHRDLKPENLFVSERNGAHFIRVMDFGISKFAADSLKVTLPGVPMGTPLYMPPEQFREARDVDARADVYSLGVVLYEMLAGGVPYEAKSFAELGIEVLGGRAPRVKTYRPDVPDALDTIVMRCLAVDPNERVPSMRELSRLLEPFSNHPRRPESERGAFEFNRVAQLATPYRPPALAKPPAPSFGSQLWNATSATFKGALVVIGLLAAFVAVVLFTANQRRPQVVIPPPQYTLPVPLPVQNKGPRLEKIDDSTWSLKGLGALDAKLLVQNETKKPVNLTIEGERLTCDGFCTVHLPAGTLKLDGDYESCIGKSTITVADGDTWVFNPGALTGYELQEAIYGGYMGSGRKELRIDGAVLFRLPPDIDFLFEELPKSVQVPVNAFGITQATTKRALARRAHASGVTCTPYDGVRISKLDDGIYAAQRTDSADAPSVLVWVDVPTGIERLQVEGVMVADLPKGQHRLLLPPGTSTLSLGGFTGIKATMQAGHTYLFAPGARRSFTIEERRYGDSSLPRWGAAKAIFRPPDFVELWTDVTFAPWPETVGGFLSADVLRITPNAPKPWSADAVAEFKKLDARAKKLSPELLEQHHARIAGLETNKPNDCELALIRASLSEAESGTNEYVPYTKGLEPCPGDPRRRELSIALQVKIGGCKKLTELAAIDGGLPDSFAAQLAACPRP